MHRQSVVRLGAGIRIEMRYLIRQKTTSRDLPRLQPHSACLARTHARICPHIAKFTQHLVRHGAGIRIEMRRSIRQQTASRVLAGRHHPFEDRRTFLSNSNVKNTLKIH